MLQRPSWRQRLIGASGCATLIAALGALPASAAGPTDVSMQQTVPPGTGQPQQQTLVGVSPAPPVPPGAEPTDLPPVPARFSDPLGPFTMFMEIVASASPSQFGLLASPGCVSDSVYKRGMKLVFRFELYDLANNVRLTSTDGTTAEVDLADGTVVPAYFRPRGAPGSDPNTTGWLWTGVWQIPTDYPLGPVMYSVNVNTGDGRQGSIDPPSLPGQPYQPGVPIAVAGTFPTIIP